MSTMYIAEFKDIIYDQHGRTVPVVKCSNIVEQAISFTGTAGTSAAFASDTVMVRIVCDAIAHLAFGKSPTATANNTIKVEADTPEYFGVIGSEKVSAITGS